MYISVSNADADSPGQPRATGQGTCHETELAEGAWPRADCIAWRRLEQACLQSWKSWPRSVYRVLPWEEVLAVVPERAPGVRVGQRAKRAQLLPLSAAIPAKRRCSPCTSTELH